MLNKRYEQAETEFQTAIRLDPKLFEAYYFYARACFGQGRAEEAARWFEEASRVNPGDFQSPVLLAQVYNALSRKAQAVAARQRALQVIERHLEFHPDDARALYMGAAGLADLGQRDRALEWIRRALDIDPEDPSILYNCACAYALLGEKERAFSCLEKGLTRGAWFKGWAEHDSDLDSLRSDSRFQTLMKSL
jgi:adenylate cyclase